MISSPDTDIFGSHAFPLLYIPGAELTSPHKGSTQLVPGVCRFDFYQIWTSMDSTNASQESIASQPSAAGETQQTHSPEPIEPVMDTEFPLVSRLTLGLQQYDWHRLQEKYADAMDEHSRVEEDLRSETTKLLEVMASIAFILDNTDSLSGFLCVVSDSSFTR